GARIDIRQHLRPQRLPLLASPQGRVAERPIKCREVCADREAGVVFRLRTRRKNTPAASASVAPQNFVDDAATPCSDARREMCLFNEGSLLTPPSSAGIRSRLLLTWSSSITWSADPLRCLHRLSEASRSSGRGYSLHPFGALPHH